MGRKKQYFRGLSIRFTPLDTTFISYYAWKHRLDKSEVVREVLGAYVEADEDFDCDEYLQFLKKGLKEFTLLDDDDPRILENMRKLGREYAKTRKAQEEI